MRKILLSLVLVIAMSAFLFGNTSYASEVTAIDDSTLLKTFGPYKFKTKDGQWDGQLVVPSGGADVTVTVRKLNFTGDPMVRLCNAASGNCTGFGPLRQPSLTRTFTNMLPGTYYGDVVTGTVTSSGTISFNVR
ncbi:hypothetical protein M3E13_16490 [Oceanobacillus kimchii]|uniref:hypothetical protein n=2 Tax=Oceanobacillus kimchii TaxID=746691 RepID=UPI0021A647F0|nr:hypothetical protein [Oceanobacillus kimchii]MCT1577932.1 hypothetical protein [Oceanobacillus kimchii]MCT2137492.1 hypothetical protein [Oceanobacillus kimchii]